MMIMLKSTHDRAMAAHAMTENGLLERIAGQALAGLLGNDLDGPPGKAIAGHADHFASLSYRYADAMLLARQEQAA